MATGDTTAALVRAKFGVMTSDKASVEAKWDTAINNARDRANQLVNSAMIAASLPSCWLGTPSKISL